MAPGNHTRNHQKRPVLKLGCWNVRTMMTGLSASLQEIKDSRKTTVINDELRRLNVDIAALQETWLADSSTLKEKYYTFFWQGKRSSKPREHGVRFAVRNSLLRMAEPGSGGSKRLLTLRLNTTIHPNQHVCPNTVRHTRHERHVLREPCIHHQEHSQQGTSCCSGWLQCQSGCRSWFVALLPWSVRSRQNEWKWTATTGAVHLSWPVHYELLLSHLMMWRSTLNQHLKAGEEKLVNAEIGKGACRKECNNSNRLETTHKCDFCGRYCFSTHRSLQPQATLQQSNRQDNQDVLPWSNLIDGGHSSSCTC